MTPADLVFDAAGDALVAGGRFTVHRVGAGSVYMAGGNTEEAQNRLLHAAPADATWFGGWLAAGPDPLPELLRWMEESE